MTFLYQLLDKNKKVFNRKIKNKKEKTAIKVEKSTQNACFVQEAQLEKILESGVFRAVIGNDRR